MRPFDPSTMLGVVPSRSRDDKLRVAPRKVEGRRAGLASLAVLSVSVLLPAVVNAQTAASTETQPGKGSRAADVAKFLAGGAIGLLGHEGGHLLFNVVFDADPGLRRVDFHGIPFFAITHRPDLPPAQELTVSSAGFWVQHAGSEWLLTKRPRLRFERGPIAKGVLAFNLLASAAYAGTAFARTGPPERDTRGMAVSAGIDERWIGTLILAPAVLDTWRYFDPEARWAVWMSRAVKVGAVLLVVRAAGR